MRIPREFLVGTLSSLFAALLIAAMSLVVHGIRIEAIAVRVVVSLLYVLLLVGTAFIFLAGGPGRIDPASRVPRFGRWPKTIAVTGLVIGLVPLVWAFIPYSILPLRIRAENHGRYTVLVSDQAFFLVKIPESPASDAIVDRGRCQLSWLVAPVQRDKPLLIFPGGSADFKCEILNPIAYRRFVQSENMDIEVLLTNGHGLVVSATMGLNKHALENHWLAFEFKDQAGTF